MWRADIQFFLFFFLRENKELINSLERSPSLKADNSSASQKTFVILWSPKFYYCVRREPTLVPVQTQMNGVHAFPSYFSLNSILVLSYHLSLYSS